MRKRICILLALTLLLPLLAGCRTEDLSENSIQDEISREISINASEGVEVICEDSHGGFHGDGKTYVVLSFSDDTVQDQIASSTVWNPLPLSENLAALVYGLSTSDSIIGPYLTDEDNQPIIPAIENGYYFFLDRHSESTNPHDDTDVLDRASFNFTIAIFDTDTNTLYYVEFDT